MVPALVARYNQHRLERRRRLCHHYYPSFRDASKARTRNPEAKTGRVSGFRVRSLPLAPWN